MAASSRTWSLAGSNLRGSALLVVLGRWRASAKRSNGGSPCGNSTIFAEFLYIGAKYVKTASKGKTSPALAGLGDPPGGVAIVGNLIPSHRAAPGFPSAPIHHSPLNTKTHKIESKSSRTSTFQGLGQGIPQQPHAFPARSSFFFNDVVLEEPLRNTPRRRGSRWQRIPRRARGRIRHSYVMSITTSRTPVFHTCPVALISTSSTASSTIPPTLSIWKGT